MANTPEYTRKAVDNYRKKFDIMQLRLPKGTRDRIEKQADKAHDFVVDCVLAELERLEAQEAQQTVPEEGYQDKLQNNNNSTKPMTLADAQAILDRKRAEQKERDEMLEKARQERKEQDKAERKKVINEAIDSIRNQEEEQ